MQARFETCRIILFGKVSGDNVQLSYFLFGKVSGDNVQLSYLDATNDTCSLFMTFLNEIINKLSINLSDLVNHPLSKNTLTHPSHCIP